MRFIVLAAADNPAFPILCDSIALGKLAGGEEWIAKSVTRQRPYVNEMDYSRGYTHLRVGGKHEALVHWLALPADDMTVLMPTS